MSGGSAGSIESASLLLDFISENLCTQHVFDPTRFNNILDLYISNAENLVSHVSTVDTPLSDHRRVEIFLSYNPCSTVSSEPPDFIVLAFRRLDFQKADFSKISGMIASVKWAEILESCSKDDIPELFTETLLQVCQAGCPRKVPPKNKTSSSVRIPSRRKRKLQAQLNEAVNNPYSPLTHIESLKRKLALAHIDIRDAINQDLLYREQQAVSKRKIQSTSTVMQRSFPRKKATSAYYTTEMATLSQIPRILPISYKISFCLSLVIPQKLTLMLHPFLHLRLIIHLLMICWISK